jgi:hypothetical protein
MARSPNYPRLSLREAIEQVRIVYESEDISTKTVSKEDIGVALGFRGTNGASLGIISALRKYGLLQDEGSERVRVSGEALSILLYPRNDSRRIGAIEKAAFAPKPLADFYRASGRRPPGQDVLRQELEERGFLPKAIDEVVRIYYDNLAFVFGEATEYTGTDEQVNEQPLEDKVQPQQSVNGSNVSPAPDSKASAPAFAEPGPLKEYLHVFARGREARLYIGGEVTQETLDRIIAHLNLLKEDFVNEGPTQVAQSERSAVDASKL